MQQVTVRRHQQQPLLDADAATAATIVNTTTSITTAITTIHADIALVLAPLLQARVNAVLQIENYVHLLHLVLRLF